MINVFHIVSSKEWDGAAQYAHDMVSRLRHEPDTYVEAVCSKHYDVIKRFRRLEVPVSILPLKGSITDWDSPRRFARLINKGHNIVHVHTFRDAFMAVWARRLSKNPCTRIVMTVHNLYEPRHNYFYRRIFKAIDWVVFVSNMVQHVFASGAHRLDLSHSSVIRESVLLPAMEAVGAPVNLREHYHMEPQQALIMYHGRLAPEKGLEVLLRAVTQLDKNSFKLVIAGSGTPKFTTQLKGFIVANQLVRNVMLLGYSDHIHALIDQCDFGVTPSIIPEPLGITGLEYMMQGKAHITTNNGAQQEYVNHGKNGLLVQPDNYTELAASLQQLITDTDLRERLGRQAKEDFEQELNYDKSFKAMMQLYKELLSL